MHYSLGGLLNFEMKTLPLNLAINPVSFGQVSTALLRELYHRDRDVIISPIANQVDFSAQGEDPDFQKWIEESISKFTKTHKRENRIFKLWHLGQSLESFSNEQVLFSFYELDQPTPQELNIVKNNHKVLFSCSETVDVFKKLGCENVHYVPLGFDSRHFRKTNKKYFTDGRITFSVLGKFENRKNHPKIIQAWSKRFGDDTKYALHCAIWNPFLKPEDNAQISKSLTNGRNYFNVVFSGYMQKNSQYNDFLNSSDIVIGMSGGEGWGLPEFQSVCLGKHAVILNASAYRDWATKENSVLVSPSGKRDVYDNMFFHKGHEYNQGQIYDFNEDEFIAGCEEAIKRVEANRLNEEGEKLKDKFSYDKTLDKILEHME